MKNPNAQSLGRLGGLKRWSKVSPKQRSKMMSELAKLRHKKLADKRVGG